jgi:hypothetical protein
VNKLISRIVDGVRVDEVVAMSPEEIGEWQAASEAASVRPVPVAVTARQIRLALLEMKLLDEVEAVIAAADRAVQIEWEFANVIRRDHGMWSIGAQALGKTEEEIDALFLAAELI